MFDQKMTEMNGEGDGKKGFATDGTIQCHTWELEADPVLLPSLPTLPNLADQTDNDDTRLIQIAGYEDHIVGLTNKGHVLIFDSLGGETDVSNGRWQYLPNFSEVHRVRSHPTFVDGKATAPSKMMITHVSAHFRRFIAYSTDSSSVVLMGDLDTTPESMPQVIPELQNRSVISVELGDYHYAALTADGKLLTWGGFSNGALGLGDPGKLDAGVPGGFATNDQRQRAIDNGFGDPPAVDVPTEVRFDHNRKRSKDRFCLSATASGWHTGALVIDLEPNEHDDDSDVEVEFQDTGRNLFRGRLRGGPHHIGILPHDPNAPAIGRGGPVFRVGFAGRGLGRGTQA